MDRLTVNQVEQMNDALKQMEREAQKARRRG